ncbi:MAG: hypothetical protein Q7T76_00545 [Ferruginibacter sp.]|nr:hypothetical protein [Ferruginibacter sp.]
MQKGLTRFEFFFNQLQELLATAVKQKNPALWLYRNNARTPLFMLEALAKLYGELHNEKKFTRIREHFKLLEDTIGDIDYYDTIAKDLAPNKKVPATIISYLQAETREKIQSLNEILLEKGWLKPDNNRLVKIHKKLSKADWLEEKAEMNAIKDFYGKAIYEIIEFVQEKKFHFENMEDDVHELRRKLRWLSIYPQAVSGCIQLEKKPTAEKHLKKYATPDIINSPFNKMPPAGLAKYVLLLEQDSYYALSWMIAELGRLKDDGLHIIAVKEGLQVGAKSDDAVAFKEAYKILGKKQAMLPLLLEEAQKISKTFFNEHVLENLVLNVTKTPSFKPAKTKKKRPV